MFGFLHVGIRENLLHLYQDPDNIVEILRQHKAIYHAIPQGGRRISLPDNEKSHQLCDPLFQKPRIGTHYYCGLSSAPHLFCRVPHHRLCT
jgi:hypothetical protein